MESFENKFFTELVFQYSNLRSMVNFPLYTLFQKWNLFGIFVSIADKPFSDIKYTAVA